MIGVREPDGLMVDGVSLLLCPVEEAEWNRLLSPWPAERVFSGTPPFDGGAEAFFQELELQIHPYLSACTGKQFLCGYSLAGLFSLYICSLFSKFDGCASVSGSLWYPGWIEWLNNHPIQCRSVYLSVGDREKNSRNKLMKTVEDRTQETGQMIAAYAETVFELNPGGHFQDETKRLHRALSVLTENRYHTLNGEKL